MSEEPNASRGVLVHYRRVADDVFIERCCAVHSRMDGLRKGLRTQIGAVGAGVSVVNWVERVCRLVTKLLVYCGIAR